MINKIIEAIATAIHAEYPNDTIEIEDIKQGLKRPCFLITSISPSRTKLIGSLYEFDTTFMTQRFPQEKDNYRESLNDDIETLSDILEMITIKYIDTDTNKVHAIKMESNVVDGVLNFKVRYRSRYCKPDESELMKSMVSTTIVKG